MDIGSFLNTLKDFKPNKKFAGAILIVYAFFVFIPETWKIAIILKSYETYIHIAGLISIAYLVIELIVFCYKKYESKQKAKLYKDYLNKLSIEEKEILQKFIYKGKKSASLDYNSGIVQGLVSFKIIYRTGTIYQGFSPNSIYLDYNIQPWVWDHLNENKHLIEI